MSVMTSDIDLLRLAVTEMEPYLRSIGTPASNMLAKRLEDAGILSRERPRPTSGVGKAVAYLLSDDSRDLNYPPVKWDGIKRIREEIIRIIVDNSDRFEKGVENTSERAWLMRRVHQEMTGMSFGSDVETALAVLSLAFTRGQQ